jgi:hypothetical protein
MFRGNGFGYAGLQRLLVLFAGPSRGEKSLQQGGGFRAKDPFNNFHPMIQKRRIGYLKFASHAAEPQIASPEHQSANARGDQRAGAHGARLQRAVERGITQPIIAQRECALPQREHFGMRGGVQRFDRRIAALADNLADRHLAGLRRFDCQRQGMAHPPLMLFDGGHYTGHMRTGIILLCAAAALLAESSAGLKWTAPAGWISKGSAPMRAATYTVQDAECVVYFFGAGQGGSVDANITRWKGQFTVNGQPAPAKVTTRTVHELRVTEMDVSGTYVATGGAAMTAQAPKSDIRMLAAIVEGPGGNLFVKFTGPEKTVSANKAKFEQLVNSFSKQ